MLLGDIEQRPPRAPPCGPGHPRPAGRCGGLGPGRGWSSFDLSPAPQLRKVDLSHHGGAQCQRSTPAALQLADVDFSQPAAAHTSTALAQALPRQLVDRAITSKPPELADGRSVHPPGMDAPARPVARPEHVTAVLVWAMAVLARFSLDTSYLQARRHAGTRAATSRGSETC